MTGKSKHAFALMDLFDSLYEQQYGRAYRGNKYADKWGFMDLIDDLGYKEARVVVKYYFRTEPKAGHDRQHLIYHYHEYHAAVIEARKERERKREIIERMRRQDEG